jgi:hypothetical protein
MKTLKNFRQVNIISAKYDTNYIKKNSFIYYHFINNNSIVFNIKYLSLFLTNIYKVLKHLLIFNGKFGFINFNYKSVSYKFKRKIINIYNDYSGGYFTSNFYLKKKRYSDVFFLSDILLNDYFLVNELFILKKPIISFSNFNYNLNAILYKIVGYKDFALFYNKLFYYYIVKLISYKRFNFFLKLI